MAVQANKCGQTTIVCGFLNLACRHTHTAEIPAAKTEVLQGICINRKTLNTDKHLCAEWHLNSISRFARWHAVNLLDRVVITIDLTLNSSNSVTIPREMSTF
jgi:hypothetical protein